MKKKFLVGLVALALPLTACDLSSLKFWEKKNNENSQENQGGNQEPSRTNLVIEEYVADIIGRDSFSEDEKAYFVSCAFKADDAKVDIAKVEKYIEEFPLIENESTAFLDIADYLVDIQKDGGLDDCAYFIEALGKSILYAGKNNEGAEKELISALLTVLEGEENKLGANIYGLVNTLVDTYSLATKLTFLTACQSLIEENGKFNTSSLKKVLEDGSGILEKFAEAKTNVVYFVNLAKTTAKSVADVYKKTETDEFSVAMFNVVDRVLELDIGAAVGFVFDFVKDFATSVKTLDASYYAKINELENPAEADLYAIFALLEHSAKDFTINFDKVEEAVGDIYDFAKEIYGYIKNQIGEVPTFVETIVNSANTELVLVKAAKLIVDLLNVRLDSINPLSLAKICNTLFFTANTSSYYPTIYVESWDEVDQRIKDLVNYSSLELELTNYGSYYFEEYDEIVIDANGNASSTHYFLNAHRYAYGAGPDEYYDYFYFTISEKSLPNLDEVGSLIYAVIAEIADSTIPTDLVTDLLELVPTASDLFDEFKNELGIDEETLDTIDMIVDFVENNPELIKKTVGDLFKVVKNLASAFVSVGGKEAEINLTEFVLKVMIEGFDPSMFQVSEGKLDGIVSLLEDVYNIADAFNALEDVVSLVKSLLGVETIETIDDFTSAIYEFLKMMFVPEVE